MPLSKHFFNVLLLVFGLGPSVCWAGAPIDVRTVGDGGSTRIDVENRSVYSVPIILGSTGGVGVQASAERYAKTGFSVQCAEGMNGETPALVLSVDGRKQTLAIPSPDFSQGVPALLVTDARMGRARLETIIRDTQPDLSLRHISPSALPSYFGALRLAPFIVMGLQTLSALTDVQRDAIRSAVAAGSALVVAAGDSLGSDDVLSPFGSFELGDSQTPDAAVATKLTRVATQREIRLNTGIEALVTSSRGVVVAQSSLGLGAVRVLATPLRDLESGPIATALFSTIETGNEQTIAWLRRGRLTDDSARSLLGGRPWLFLVLLPLAFFFTRGRRKLAALVAVVWTLGAVAVSAKPDMATIHSESTLAFPFGDKSVHFVSTELTIRERGQTVIELPHGEFSLEDAYPNGACLVRNGSESVWVIPGEPGDRVRLTYISVGGPVFASDVQLGEISDWPRGPLSGHPVHEMAPSDSSDAQTDDALRIRGVMEGRFRSRGKTLMMGGRQPTVETP